MHLYNMLPLKLIIMCIYILLFICFLGFFFCIFLHKIFSYSRKRKTIEALNKIKKKKYIQAASEHLPSAERV